MAYILDGAKMTITCTLCTLAMPIPPAAADSSLALWRLVEEHGATEEHQAAKKKKRIADPAKGVKEPKTK